MQQLAFWFCLLQLFANKNACFHKIACVTKYTQHLSSNSQPTLTFCKKWVDKTLDRKGWI